MPELRRMRPLLGTFVEVCADGPGAALAIDRAFVVLNQANSAWSFHSPLSELTRLNSHPGDRVPVSPVTARLLRLARAVTSASGGAFNLTVGGQIVIGGGLPDHGGPLPIPCGTAQDVEVGHGWARLARPVRVTLDGIAKGFAIDMAVEVMRREGALGGWVNAGGDLRVFGTSSLVVHRREPNGKYSPLGSLTCAALATSIVTDGPDSDFPAWLVATGGALHHGLHTVLARTAWRADALTKVAANCEADLRSAEVSRLGGKLVESGGQVWH